MGLDTTHDCWHGPYSSFMEWRRKVACCIGIDLDKMEGFCRDGIPWSTVKDEPLVVLLSHSDCDGSISKKHLLPLAFRLDEIASQLEQYDVALPEGLREHFGSAPRARQFAAGLRLAASRNECVRFH